MIIYEAIKSEFIKDVKSRTIDDKIHKLIKEKAGHRVSTSEFSSWSSSLTEMCFVLDADTIPDNAGIAIEYKIPNTSKRVDFIVSGTDDYQNRNVIIVELKQWSKVQSIDNMDAIILTVMNKNLVKTTHPSYQAWSYASLIKDYNETVYKENIELYPCSYLHNYKSVSNDPLYAKHYQAYIEKAPIYIKGDVVKLSEFISKYIKHGDDKDILYEIEKGRIKPSKALQDSVRLMIEGHAEFKLIDHQKVIFEDIINLADQAAKNRKKTVMIIEGGPGTGKSVVAIQALSTLIGRGKNSMYVTKNSAPREVFVKKLRQGQMRNVQISNLFTGSGSFTQTGENTFDCLIVDEAHRLNKKSGMMQNLGENQIKEIIFSSMFSVFFIDENQRVTTQDFGSIDEIKKWAKHYNAIIHTDILESQFRCSGSDGYLAWLDSVLEIRETANETYSSDFEYDFKVIDDPNQLREMIIEKNKEKNKARLLAGYCWNWDTNGRNNTDHHDIVIDEYDFKMSWNLGNTKTYAEDDGSVDQVGCIHTSQGLEFDYVGVIIGEDLRYENGEILTDYSKRAKTDQSLKGIKKMMKEDKHTAMEVADEIIKNTYRTLMTRGQKGCYIFCVDPALQGYFKSLIKNTINSKNN